MLNRIITLTFCLVVSLSLVKAQDFHWSLIHLNPIYLNPANTGFAQKKNRITGLYRDQWRSVPVPFSTTNIAYDRNVYYNETLGWRIGLGGQFLFDKSGDGALSVFRPALSLAVGKYLNKDKQRIQLGIHTAYVRKQIDFSKLTFDSQYNGMGFDPSFPNGEAIAGDRASYFDLGIGTNFFTNLKKVGNLDLGFSVFNLTSPNYNFLSGSEESVQPRYVAYTKANINLGQSRWTFNPGAYYQHQGKAQETLIQSIFGVKLGKEPINAVELQFGPGYRIGDAVVAYVGVNWKDLKAGFAFDGNTSDLRTASNGRGAYELALNYVWERKKKKEPQLFEPPIDTTVKKETPQEDSVSIPEPIIEEKIPQVDIPDTISETLKLRAAVKLFFANDQPNPKTRDTTTDISYIETYHQYIQELGKIQDDKSQGFAEEVKNSTNQLNKLLDEILLALQNGKTIVAEVRGFASPLASSNYNVSLSKRRVASLLNYLNEWNQGALKSYIDKGQLRFDNHAYGSAQAADDISSDPKNRAKSIYSTDASFERRVELKVIEVK